jgi:hypothetical protein
MATPLKVSVVVNTSSDWDEWIQVVKTQAIAEDIWGHVDPKWDVIGSPLRVPAQLRMTAGVTVTRSRGS